MTRIYAISAAVIVAAFLGGLAAMVFLREDDDPFGPCRTSKIAGAGQIGGPFELVNAAGETVTDRDVISEPSLVYFGYTFCPDVCPLDNARNAEAVDLLAERG